MNLTSADGSIFWLYALLFCAGVLVWAGVGLSYVNHRPCLKIDPWPRREALALAWEQILLVLIFFLFGTQIAREMVLSLKIASSGSKELQELSQGMLADIGGKLFAGGLLVYLLRKYVRQDLLFEGRKTGDESLLRRLPLWSRTLLMVGAIYLAIFPLVNDLLLRLGIFLVERVLHISVPEGHQVFELLDDPSSLFAVKVGSLLMAAVISPIVEELFFRGLIQNILYKAFHRPWPAIGITAILFMLVHTPMYQQMPSLGVLGLILGWSYYRYRSLAVPVLTHIVFNSVTLIFWALGAGK